MEEIVNIFQKLLLFHHLSQIIQHLSTSYSHFTNMKNLLNKTYNRRKLETISKKTLWGGRPGSNRQPLEPQSNALPIELQPPIILIKLCFHLKVNYFPGKLFCFQSCNFDRYLFLLGYFPQFVAK